jgi:hypothetical protein
LRRSHSRGLIRPPRRDLPAAGVKAGAIQLLTGPCVTTLVEGKRPGGFLVWEVLRDYTRETVTIAAGAGKLAPGTVLGKITTGGKYTVLTPGASNGSQNAAGLLWGKADATRAHNARPLIRSRNGLS